MLFYTICLLLNLFYKKKNTVFFPFIYGYILEAELGDTYTIQKLILP